MKLSVDQDKCIGCGACVAISPENFDFNDDGLSVVKNEEITEKTMDAVEACPTFAISTTNDGEQVDTCTCEHCECDNCECDNECSCGDECNCTEECNCGCIADVCDCDECHCNCECENEEDE